MTIVTAVIAVVSALCVVAALCGIEAAIYRRRTPMRRRKWLQQHDPRMYRALCEDSVYDPTLPTLLGIDEEYD